MGSLVSLNDTTRIAVVNENKVVPYAEDGLLRVVDEMRKAVSPEDVTKVLDIALSESRRQLFIPNFCTITGTALVQSLHQTLEPLQRSVVLSNEERTKQAEYDARTKQVVAEEVTKQAAEATKQAEIAAQTKREESERRTKRAEDERRVDEMAHRQIILLLQKKC